MSNILKESVVHDPGLYNNHDIIYCSQNILWNEIFVILFIKTLVIYAEKEFFKLIKEDFLYFVTQ
jgi:hypothetical protein